MAITMTTHSYIHTQGGKRAKITHNTNLTTPVFDDAKRAAHAIESEEFRRRSADMVLKLTLAKLDAETARRERAEAKLEFERQEHERHLQDEQATVSELQKSRKSQQEEVHSLQGKLWDAGDRVSELEGKLQQASKLESQLWEVAEGKQAEVDELDAQRHEAEIELKDAKADCQDMLKAASHAHEEELRSKSEEISKHERSAAKRQRTIERLTAELRYAVEQIADLKSMAYANGVEDSEEETLNKPAEPDAAEIQRLRTYIGELEAGRKTDKERMQRQDAEIESLRKPDGPMADTAVFGDMYAATHDIQQATQVTDGPRSQAMALPDVEGESECSMSSNLDDDDTTQYVPAATLAGHTSDLETARRYPAVGAEVNAFSSIDEEVSQYASGRATALRFSPIDGGTTFSRIVGGTADSPLIGGMSPIGPVAGPTGQDDRREIALPSPFIDIDSISVSPLDTAKPLYRPAARPTPESLQSSFRQSTTSDGSASAYGSADQTPTADQVSTVLSKIVTPGSLLRLNESKRRMRDLSKAESKKHTTITSNSKPTGIVKVRSQKEALNEKSRGSTLVRAVQRAEAKEPSSVWKPFEQKAYEQVKPKGNEFHTTREREMDSSSVHSRLLQFGELKQLDSRLGKEAAGQKSDETTTVFGASVKDWRERSAVGPEYDSDDDEVL